MSELQYVLQLARALGPAEQQQLIRALTAGSPAAGLPLLAPSAPSPHSAAWVRAERGHAVLATEPEATADIPPGAGAIAGIWPHLAAPEARVEAGRPATAYSGPVLVATDVCLGLARGEPGAWAVFTGGRLEIRLSTVSYLELLACSTGPEDDRRLRQFVAPYAVLSLGPVASNRSVELLFAHREEGLDPLRALVAATALAHEIPLVAHDVRPFARIDGLRLLAPY
jgi:predicted nucleic acid-binding protein